MHWYLVQTKSRQEKFALENLHRQGYQCFLPIRPAEKIRKGTLTIEQEPLFPRYLFIRLGLNNSSMSWSPIRSTKGVSRLVRFGLEPAKVDDGLIEFLKTQETFYQKEPARLFKPGERVRIAETPFADVEGIFQMTDGDRRAMVLIDILSKSVAVHVSPSNLRKAS